MASLMGPRLSDSLRSPDDLWVKALENFNTEDKFFLSISQTDKREVLEEVLLLVEGAEKICQRKKLKWKNRKGEFVIVRDLFAKMAIWVERFKSIGDIVVQYDPGHAALPWAAARMILQAAVNDIQTAGAMLEGLEYVFGLVSKYAVIERLYFRETSITQKQLRESLTKVYTSILEFLLEAFRYYNRGKISRVAKSIFQFEETTIKYIANIKKKSLDVDGYMQLVSDEAVLKIDRRIGELTARLDSRNMKSPSYESLDMGSIGMPGKQNDDLKDIFHELSKPISRMASRLSAIDDHLNEEQRLKIFEWLSSVQYMSHHHSKVKDLLPGSGQWLLQKQEFIEWLDSSSSSVLWLHGIPGSGKSMLVAGVIEFLLCQSSADEHLRNEPAPLAYFYCARATNEPERSDPIELLRSILEQLSSSDSELPIRLPVVQAYQAKKKSARGRKPEKFDMGETVELILKLLESNPAIIVIDGLDECDPARRQLLLDNLQKILKESANVVKIFVSSRDDHDLVHRLSQTPNLYIHATDNKADIRKFVRSRVDEAIQKERLLCGSVSKRLRTMIISTLIQKAHGMFRLVSLHIERLCNPQQIKTEANVIHALSNLPMDLKRSYDVVMAQIQSSEQPNPMLAERTLKWLLCAQQGLDTKGFIQAVSADLPNKPLLNYTDVLSICCNLVVYDDELDTFRFAHLSVREYLEGLDGYSWPETHALAAEQCLSWLFSLNSPLAEPRPAETGSFHWHAINYWTLYTTDATHMRKHGRLQRLLENLLVSSSQDSCNPGFSAWVGHLQQTISLEHNVPSPLSQKYCISSPPNPLFVACAYDFDEIVERLLLDPSAFNVENSLGMNCAQIAACCNNADTLCVILSASQKIPLSVNYWHIALRFAAEEGSTWALESLLYKLGDGFVTEYDLKLIVGLMRERRETIISDVLNRLFNNNHELRVTDAILQSAFGSMFGPSIIRPLLKFAPDIKVTAQTTVRVTQDGTVTPTYASFRDTEGISAAILCHGDSLQRSSTGHEDQNWNKTSSITMCESTDQKRASSLAVILVDRTDGKFELSWRDLMAAKQMSSWGSACLTLLLRRRPKISRSAILTLISQWDHKVLRELLYYQNIKITTDVTRAAAGNLRFGAEIMMLLLERQLQEELGDAFHPNLLGVFQYYPAQDFGYGSQSKNDLDSLAPQRTNPLALYDT